MSGLSSLLPTVTVQWTVTDFYDDLAHLSHIDWDVMRAKMWYDTDNDPDRCRRRQAEFLVYEFVPWPTVDHLVVMNSAARDQVSDMLASCECDTPVRISRGWFFA